MVPVHPIVIVIIILAIGVIGFLSWQQDKKRREALRLWAQQRGWRLAPLKIKSMHRDYPALKVFQKGHSRYAKNIIKGELNGRPVMMMDYRYTVGHGKNRSTHNRGVVILACDFPTVPLFIRRENPLDRVGEFFGADDIDFESSEFSRKFFVKSADKKWAYDIIHTRTMDYLMKTPSCFTIEFGFGEIAIYQTGWCGTDNYEKALEIAWDLHELIPDYVVRQMKGEGR
jgi:hypothetical protein